MNWNVIAEKFVITQNLMTKVARKNSKGYSVLEWVAEHKVDVSERKGRYEFRSILN